MHPSSTANVLADLAINEATAEMVEEVILLDVGGKRYNSHHHDCHE
jgi:hypothetical protein